MNISAERKDILGLHISLSSYKNALQHVIQKAHNSTPSYVCFANVHMVIEARKNADFNSIVNNSTYTFSDGMPIVYALKRLHKISQERIAGIDFMIDSLKLCEEENIPVFFFGSTTEVLTELIKKMNALYPKLKIVGKISPPFRQLSELENNDYTNQINDSGAKIVFVSLGCPKQETWAAQNHLKCNSVFLCVGAAFEIHAGNKKRAPLWMQNASLEWLYRLVQDPGRMWKRYLHTNTLFSLILIKKILFNPLLKK